MKIKTFPMAMLCAVAVLWGCKGDEPIIPKKVVANFTFTQGSEGAVSFTNTSENATSFAWNFGDGNTSKEKSPTHTYSKSGNYTVKLTATNAGGSDEETKTIIVKLEGTDTQLIVNFTFTLDDEGVVKFTNTSENATGYTWDFGDGNKSNAKDTTYTFVENKDYAVKLTATNGAGESADTTKIITITNALPIASFEFTVDAQSAGGTVNFVNTSKNATGYAWDFGDGNASTDKSPTHTYAKDSTYTVKLTATNEGGSDEAMEEVTISLKGTIIPVMADFTFSIASGGVVTFTNASTNATGYTWDFGDGNTSADESPTYTYTQNGDFDVTLTATNGAGASDDTTQTVTIVLAPVSDFTFSIASGGVVTFTNASTNATGYTWDFGDGNTSTDESPTHTYTQNSDFDVTLTATNGVGASDVSTQTVTITNAVTIDIADLSQLAILENRPKGTIIVEIAAVVTNSNKTPVYSILSQNPAGAIGLNGNKMLIADSSAFDFETHTEITGEIQGTVGGVTATAVFTISIEEVVNIPDSKFKAVLVNNATLNTNGDQEISATEARDFRGSINAGGTGSIDDATGIEYFINITSLNFDGNNLKDIDVSKNTALTTLVMTNNELTALDVSQNRALTVLRLSNNKLREVDVSQNTKLTQLWLEYNDLTKVNIANGNNSRITDLDLRKNDNLTCIKVDSSSVQTVPNGWRKDNTANYQTDCN